MGSDRSSSAPADVGRIDAPGETLSDRIERLEAALGESMKQAAAHAEHLAALTADVTRELAELRDTSQFIELAETHLLARPYMSSPLALSVRDGRGRDRMGFVTTDNSAADARGRYRDFEALFRGTREQIQAKQQPYVEFAKERAPVLDLGCGRGEFLELLGTTGIEARGVDLDEGMVAEAVSSGVDALVGDIFETLAGCDDESIGMVFSAQVIEHLAPADMPRLLSEAYRVLAPHGLAVIETVNVHSVRAFRFFWLDLTHTIPVYPETALQLARSAGFSAAVITFPESAGDLATDLADCGDYALVAAKDPAVLAGLGLLD